MSGNANAGSFSSKVRWTKEEDEALEDLVKAQKHARVSPGQWSTCTINGRSKRACQDRFYLLQKKKRLRPTPLNLEAPAAALNLGAPDFEAPWLAPRRGEPPEACATLRLGAPYGPGRAGCKKCPMETGGSRRKR